MIQKDGMVVPIEVKGGNTRGKFLKSLMKNHKDIFMGINLQMEISVWAKMVSLHCRCI